MRCLRGVLGGLCALLTAAPGSVQGQFVFATNNGSLTITGFTGSFASLTIPSTTNGLPVTSIAAGAFFFDTTLTNVVIPGSVTNIGAGPFEDCQKLLAISVSSTNANYTSVNGVLFNKAQTALIQYSLGVGGTYPVPDNVTNIGFGAFLGATLTSISVGLGNSYYSSAGGILYNHAQSTLIQCPVGLSGSITVPGTVTTIGQTAFEYCTHIGSVSIPSSVTGIGAQAFYDCASVTSYFVDPANSKFTNVGGVLFNKAQTTLLFYTLAVHGAYTVPDGVKTIGSGAFGDSPGLTGIIIPDSVTSIGSGAFYGCGKLTMLTLGSGLTSLGGGAFQFSALTNVIIPAGLTSIPQNAFAGCTHLKSVYFVSNAPAINATAFASDSATTLYYLPNANGWSSPYAGYPAVLWDPIIQTGDGSFGVRNQQFAFNITSAAIIQVEVEACTNLASPNWIPLQALNVTNGAAFFSDPQWSNFPVRVYGLGFP